MNPVPIGIPGELYAGGDGLALDYLNRPELTAGPFVSNPFEPSTGSRLYRTGDIVRWKPDGNLEFLGRADGQTKIRGYRVEPGEVEEVLSGHPTVGTAAVVVREDPFTGKHLVAYVVPRAGSPIDTELLRESTQQKLPSYMVPTQFVVLDGLPLTTNGKVDRRALPAPEISPAPAAESSALPSTALEKTIANIWCEILGRPQVRLDEDFFRLGGHSLLATQVISRISKACRVELPVLAIFEAPTVAKLAKLVSAAQPCGCSDNSLKPASWGSARSAELLARLDDFSEAELEELLRDSELKSVL
jgi:acyl carrier protein